MSTINHINAGIIHTQSRMAGLSLEQAVAAARTARLAADLHAEPHRPTVVRLLRAMWLRTDAEAVRHAQAAAARADFDARVAAAYPADWSRMETKGGAKRREARRLLRKRYSESRA